MHAALRGASTWLRCLFSSLALASLTACDASDDPPSFRYRLTVEVDTPDGLQTGSSVIEVNATESPSGAVVLDGGARARARGEAVAVDLPDGQTLFALLQSENEADWASTIMFLLSPRYRGGDAYERTVFAIRRHKGARELPYVKTVGGGMVRRDGWPMLAIFGDLSDPTSIKKVDPFDLAGTFGKGVDLRRMTVQVTDDPVSTGVEQRLKWMDQYRRKWLNGRSTISQDLTTDELTARLTAGSFSTEFAQ
ncbi:hypothetical protein [uncultured Erythrobacter sp.]|uniref:hypothetical protein n=1 Tax=uncultured Erythrobacter sp. TaxID=263913 RepID=UPI00262097D8|nr:hypothetical protein [uncultured Erythrobacter sp.]